MHKIDDTLIVINSSNRVDKVKTHEKFPKGIMNWVIAVPEAQYKEYAEKFTEKRVYAIPDTVQSYLPSQRQHVMEHFGATYKYIWLMDDDLTFFRRKMKENEKGEEKPVLRKCKEKDITKMFNTMRKHLSEVSMVGISTRLGNNRITEDFDEINRVTRCYAIESSAFKEVGAVFNPFEPFVAEDFHMALCFLNAGIKNRILHTYAQEDIGSNAEGGCSTYRNSEVQKKTSFWMAENHPEVKVKGKYSKGSWGLQELKDGRNYRVDVIVGWKKAYKPKKIRKSGGLNKLFKK